jgi:hypothetical protein
VRNERTPQLSSHSEGRHLWPRKANTRQRRRRGRRRSWWKRRRRRGGGGGCRANYSAASEVTAVVADAPAIQSNEVAVSCDFERFQRGHARRRRRSEGGRRRRRRLLWQRQGRNSWKGDYCHTRVVVDVHVTDDGGAFGREVRVTEPNSELCG